VWIRCWIGELQIHVGWAITYKMDGSTGPDPGSVGLLARQSGRAQRSALIAGCVALLFCFGVLTLFWSLQVRKYYAPSGDEFSLFANSAKQFHPIFSEWFLQGFSRYFVPYPEWSFGSTNFARPVVNAEYYLSSVLFGDHWGWYLLSNYLIQSLLVASVVHLSLRHLGVYLAAAVGLGFLCFVSPAFDNGALYSTSFAFDLFAALFVIAGLNQLLSGRIVSAWIFFTLALFTKETAFFALLAAAVVIHRTSPHRGIRRFLVPACFLVPYAVWGTLRMIAFRGVHGIYAVPAGSPGTYPVQVLKEFLRWPIPFETAYRAADGTRSISFSMGVFALLNLCFWIAAFYLSSRFLRTRMRRAHNPATAAHAGADARQAMLIFCAGSIVILLLIPNLQPRFGASFVPLFALLVVAFLEGKNSVSLRALACLLLIVPPIINTTDRMLHLSRDLTSMRSRWAMAADYIRHISQTTSSTIYVVDDVSGGFSSTDSIRKFAGYRGALIRVNDLILSENCIAEPKLDIQNISLDDVKAISEIDSTCAGHGFVSSGMSYPIGDEEITRTIAQTRIIYHGVPAATVHFLSAPAKLSVDIMDPAASSILLVPDLKAKAYREIALER
jgi:hypothetical protein